VAEPSRVVSDRRVERGRDERIDRRTPFDEQAIDDFSGRRRLDIAHVDTLDRGRIRVVVDDQGARRIAPDDRLERPEPRGGRNVEDDEQIGLGHAAFVTLGVERLHRSDLLQESEPALGRVRVEDRDVLALLGEPAGESYLASDPIAVGLDVGRQNDAARALDETPRRPMSPAASDRDPLPHGSDRSSAASPSGRKSTSVPAGTGPASGATTIKASAATRLERRAEPCAPVGATRQPSGEEESRPRTYSVLGECMSIGAASRARSGRGKQRT
jgi:hypothetical protein